MDVLGAGDLPASPDDPPSAQAGSPKPPTAGLDAHGDPLPAGALLRIGTIRYRDGGGTNQAILSSDGTRLATSSEAGIMLFDLATGRRTLWIKDSGVPNGYAANYSRFAFAPMGRSCLLCSGRVMPASRFASRSGPTT